MLKGQVSRVPWPGKNRIQTGHTGTKGPIGHARQKIGLITLANHVYTLYVLP